MMETVETRQIIATSFGNYLLPKSVAVVVKAARLRRDGRPDMRTAAGKFLKRYVQVAEKVAETAYIAGKNPVLPEANDI